MLRKRGLCAYCAKPFQPPDGPWNDPNDPASYPGWMLKYCSRTCAALGMPELWPDGAEWAVSPFYDSRDQLNRFGALL